MTESSTTTDSRKSERHAIGWFLFPILALFPLVSLLTYDWRAIGALGDGFAYWGYTAIGLAIWLVPTLCIVAGLFRVAGRRLNAGMRKLWLVVSCASLACLLEAAQGHAPGIDAVLSSLNLSDAGGVVGQRARVRDGQHAQPQGDELGGHGHSLAPRAGAHSADRRASSSAW